MKALTLMQPWASLVAIGAKGIETRSWSTKYRGPLAIHASKRFGKEEIRLCITPPFLYFLYKAGIVHEGRNWAREIPLGAVIATCDLVEIIPIPFFPSRYISSFKLYGMGMYPNEAYVPQPRDRVIPIPPPEPERSFGNYKPGRYAWILENIQRLPEPIPAKGAQSLWNWEER